MLVLVMSAGAVVSGCAAERKDGPDAVVDVAEVPPLGWNSWNNFGCHISEQQIKAQADAMVASGTPDTGTSSSMTVGSTRPDRPTVDCGPIRRTFRAEWPRSAVICTSSG